MMAKKLIFSGCISAMRTIYNKQTKNTRKQVLVYKLYMKRDRFDYETTTTRI